QVSFELLSEARRLAAAKNIEVAVVLMGDGVSRFVSELSTHGVKRVFIADDTRLLRYDPGVWLATITRLCQSQKPDLFLLPATSSGEDLAARLSVEQNWPLVSRCDKVKKMGDVLEATRSIHSGKLQESTKCLGMSPYLVTVLPGVIGIRRTAEDEQVAIETLEIVIPPNPVVRVTGFVAADPALMSVEEADIIVAAGRGLGDEENVGLVRELAILLGGSVASTRVVVDLGWLGRETQVGQTGRTVKPRLYVACGVSGATQHTVGMRSSNAIVAINTDPTAPIFNIADLSLNGDVKQLLPSIINLCRERLGKTQ
ncbi:MAG: electron transfer flavoprotein subunit alpha/FixB family protein, partial [Gammaproteobacteria bacterium]|nr:electron transfer flavoprotein subunit alpha/FixB family protein [Gammaproteobacteria bacterium]